jgi:hypothetical protein
MFFILLAVVVLFLLVFYLYAAVEAVCCKEWPGEELGVLVLLSAFLYLCVNQIA